MLMCRSQFLNQGVRNSSRGRGVGTPLCVGMLRECIWTAPNPPMVCYP
jgi:hypothetical protein